MKGYDPTLIEDPAPFTVKIQAMDMAWVEQAVAMGAVVKSSR